MSSINIKIANPRDLSVVNEFLADNFHNKEPMESSHIDKSDKMTPDNEFLSSCIDCDTTLMAYEGDKLCAVLISGEIQADEAKRNLESAAKFETRKFSDILRLLSYVDAKADYCNRLKISRCLHIHIVSVHANFQGRGIAGQLINFCIENGRKMNFPAVSVDCSNYFTEKIVKKLKMTRVSSVTYDEVNDKLGETRFIPREPHMVINSYAKVF